MDTTNEHHIISEKTLLPLSLIIVIITFIFFAAQIYSLANENRLKIDKVAKDRQEIDIRLFDRLDEVAKKVNEISEKTHSIDGKMDIIILQVSTPNK